MYSPIGGCANVHPPFGWYSRCGAAVNSRSRTVQPPEGGDREKSFFLKFGA